LHGHADSLGVAKASRAEAGAPLAAAVASALLGGAA
jgi:hypothetical protein